MPGASTPTASWATAATRLRCRCASCRGPARLAGCAACCTIYVARGPALTRSQTPKTSQPLTPLQPKLVEGALEGESVTKVAAGARHTLLLCASGRAYACGWGAFGQLGTGSFASSRMPMAVAAQGTVQDLAAGWWHSLFLTQ